MMYPLVKELPDAYLANAIFDAHRDDPEFGRRHFSAEAPKQRRQALSLRHQGLLVEPDHRLLYR